MENFASKFEFFISISFSKKLYTDYFSINIHKITLKHVIIPFKFYYISILG